MHPECDKVSKIQIQKLSIMAVKEKIKRLDNNNFLISATKEIRKFLQLEGHQQHCDEICGLDILFGILVSTVILWTYFILLVIHNILFYFVCCCCIHTLLKTFSVKCMVLTFKIFNFYKTIFWHIFYFIFNQFLHSRVLSQGKQKFSYAQKNYF